MLLGRLGRRSVHIGGSWYCSILVVVVDDDDDGIEVEDDKYKSSSPCISSCHRIEWKIVEKYSRTLLGYYKWDGWQHNWQKSEEIEVYFSMPTNNENCVKYCFESISLLSRNYDLEHHYQILASVLETTSFSMLSKEIRVLILPFHYNKTTMKSVI
jgi:hypothetical protein